METISAQPTLFGVPLEIRLIIYDHLFNSVSYIAHVPRKRTVIRSESETAETFDDKNSEFHSARAILQVNRQLRVEATESFNKHLTVTVIGTAAHIPAVAKGAKTAIALPGEFDNRTYRSPLLDVQQITYVGWLGTRLDCTSNDDVTPILRGDKDREFLNGMRKRCQHSCQRRGCLLHPPRLGQESSAITLMFSVDLSWELPRNMLCYDERTYVSTLIRGPVIYADRATANWRRYGYLDDC